MDTLQRARELYESIDFSKIAIIERDKYTFDNGKCRCDVLYSNGKVEVIHCVGEAGAVTLPHVHDQVEHFLLYEGDAVIDVNGSKTCMQDSQSIAVPPLTPHGITTKKGYRMIISLIPAPVKV